VYGEPVTTAGVTVIPGAVIIGGGGGGGGLSAAGDDGGGGGFGVFARPSGAFVIKDGDVRWVPAIDYPLLIVAVTGLATGLIRARRRHRLAI
jgi:uncharacterized spore protein YtfJ